MKKFKTLKLKTNDCTQFNSSSVNVYFPNTFFQLQYIDVFWILNKLQWYTCLLYTSGLGGDVEDPKGPPNGPRRKKHLSYVGSPIA